ncbi:hypothetical protein V6N11_022719 [Hibiscus sabdariffa]|uniref:Integrase catalytic domain-containing protein n=1 Tax=Hibiscus sabdariffa TaxID=183260 RepID=A0ABR2TKL3_9ROSI
MDKVRDYEKLVSDILAKGMKMCEVLQANILVEKLPKSWSDYHNSLKHKKMDILLEANLVDTSGASGSKFKKTTKKGGQNQVRKPKSQKTTNFKKPGKPKTDGRTVKCYVCGLAGHKAYLCQHHEDHQHVPQMNVAKDKDDDIIAAVVSEVNLVENNVEWVVDTGASKHFCATREYFTEFEGGNKGEKVYMGNSNSSEVLGKGKVLLKLTSGKTLAFNNILYVPALSRNLISGGLLKKACIKLVFETDKLVLFRNGDYIGKCFLNGDLFVIETQLNENKVSTSDYIVETVDMWHARLGHANIHFLKKMMKMNILLKLDITNFNKCEICVEAKHAKPHFKNISNRKTELLELIHTDLADFRNNESKGGKHYYITFVDDFSRYKKVYLLRTKDEAEKFFLIYKTKVENQLDRRIKRLRYDRGGEYGSNFLKEGNAPNLQYLKVWGSLAIVGLPDFKKSIIGSKTVDAVFIGLSRYTHNPSNEHWIDLKCLLKYLRGTMDWKLNFVGFPVVLEGNCYANWVSDNDEVSSTRGYVFTLGGAAISWKSSKQTCIARSTMESEFIALDLAGQEAKWLKNLLAEIPL